MVCELGQGLSHPSILEDLRPDGDGGVGWGGRTELPDSGLPAGQVTGLMESHAF